jgi:hypothetical protein
MKIRMTLKGKMIAGFLAIILVFFSVFVYMFYEMLAPQMIDAQLDMQTRYAKILCQQIALWNVNQRLKVYYGRDSGVHIVSVSGQGTRVTLRLKVRPSGD